MARGVCACAVMYEGTACDISVAGKPCPSDATNDKECSGHGTCDGMFGVCRCARPHFGAACEQQLDNIRVVIVFHTGVH